MSRKISPIEKDVVHRICSGQVVLNLATAIKELLENSLDAGATAVEIRLKEYGSQLIEVIDNGIGVHPDNFQALTLKHHTSKLSSFDDLESVETFGFRGEALSSLCALSELTVITRHETQAHGTKLIFNSLGNLEESSPCPRQIGTTVSLGNIFASLPVRQKEFNRNLKKEFAKATQLISAYCLIATNVKITCSNQTKAGSSRYTFLSTQGAKTLRENIPSIFGHKQLTHLIPIMNHPPNKELMEELGKNNADIIESIRLDGFISSCEHNCGRSCSDRQFYFINCRPCEPAKIMKTVNEIYHQFNPHQYPFVLLNIILPKESVDINVTPDKRLLFLRNEKLLIALIKYSILKLYENIPSTYRLNNIKPVSSSLNFVNTETAVPVSPLTMLNKWRHASDRSNSIVASIAEKRSNTQLNGSPCKQRKLDDLMTFIKEKKISRIDVTDDDDDVGSHSFDVDLQCEVAADTFNTCEEIYEPKQSLNIIHFDKIQYSTVDRAMETCGDQNHEPVNSSSVLESSPKSISDRGLVKGVTCEIDHHKSDVKLHDDNADDSEQSETELEAKIESINVYDCSQPITSDRRNYVTLDTSLEILRERLKQMRSQKDNTRINRFHAEIDPNANALAETELSKEISKDMFSKMEIVGQFNLGFIVTKLDQDLFIVDQHASDEKYNFETLQRTTSLKCQKLVIPKNLDLTAGNECTLIENIDVLKQNGFEFSIDLSAEPTKRIKLTSIPTSYSWQFGKEDVDEMLFMLQDAPNSVCRPSRVRNMFASRACRKSVMIGTSLNAAEMKRIINNMGEIEQPWNCPHGRPTMRHLVNLSLLS